MAKSDVEGSVERRVAELEERVRQLERWQESVDAERRAREAAFRELARNMEAERRSSRSRRAA